MAKHVKPTQEELEANAQKALEEAEELEKEDKETKPQETEETQEEPKKEVKEDQEEAEQVDYKKRYIESTREGQVLFAKNKKLTEALEQANQLPEPTQEDLIKEYPEWEEMTTLERRFAKDNFVNNRRLAFIDQVRSEFSETDKWVNKVSDFITNPKTLNKYQELEGQEDKFLSFATKPTRRGVDFEDLVSAFLFQNKPVKNKGSLLESSVGGNKGQRQDPTKITVEEARSLRETDYKKYVELLKSGKIEQQSI